MGEGATFCCIFVSFLVHCLDRVVYVCCLLFVVRPLILTFPVFVVWHFAVRKEKERGMRLMGKVQNKSKKEQLTKYWDGGDAFVYIFANACLRCLLCLWNGEQEKTLTKGHRNNKNHAAKHKNLIRIPLLLVWFSPVFSFVIRLVFSAEVPIWQQSTRRNGCVTRV